MNTQLNGQMSIKDYADKNGLSVSTIRRRIKAGTLPAEQVSGKWYILVEEVSNPDPPVDSQIEQVDNQLVARLESEVDYLRDQLDKQTQLLAISTKQNTDLIGQLPPPRRSFFSHLIARLHAGLRTLISPTKN